MDETEFLTAARTSHESRQIITFLLPLDRPMAIPFPSWFINPLHEEVPWLKEAALPKFFEDPIFKSGRNFVAFTPYQTGGKTTRDSKPLALAQFTAMALMHSTGPGTTMQNPEDEVISDGLRYTTLAMDTVLLTSDSEEPIVAINRALDRCFESLRPFELAYCLVSDDRAYTLTTRRSAASICPFIIYDATVGDWTENGLLQINDSDEIRLTVPDMIDGKQVNELAHRLWVTHSGLPFTSAEYWAREAQQTCFLRGMYDVAAVQAFTAGEIFLDSALMLLAWEELSFYAHPTVTRDEVASWFTNRNTHRWRVNTQFRPRLAGWDDGSSPRPHDEWINHALKIRSSVVHSGYMPSIEETSSIIEIYGRVVERVKVLLADDRNRPRYPRSASLVLGAPGLLRLGVYNRRMRELHESEDTQAWMYDYIQFQKEMKTIIEAQFTRL